MMMRRALPALLVLLLCLFHTSAAPKRAMLPQEEATIQVDAASRLGAFVPAWNYFGYDEPNYTYGKYGKKLLSELSALSPSPVYIRTHNLLTSGDGTASLKWGSTNAYTEDASGKPVYDWTVMDRIFDAYRDTHTKPLVEIGFTPEALSTRPQPYRHTFPKGDIYTGWTYPPRDYQKWAELIYQWVRHEIARYGQKEVETWLWEVWNEPDIRYWQGTPEEFLKLYDYAADAVRRALPKARIGGPETTGGGTKFLRDFLEHCVRGRNYATGKIGAPLDFLSFHPKGRPRFLNGHVQMGMDAQLKAIARNFEVIASFPEWRNTPIILGESDPEGCAACSVATHPENAYRDGPLYAVYTAASVPRIYELADTYHVNLRGIVTWAFTFEGEPFFAGYRELATNGIDKPVLNVFRMFGKMRGTRLRVESSSEVPVEEIMRAGVRGHPDIQAMATRDGNKLAILLWNYHDDDVPAPDAAVHLRLKNLPKQARRITVQQYRMDTEHSNAYAVWKANNAPQTPTTAQYAMLEAAGKLQRLGDRETHPVAEGSAVLDLRLPRQGVALLEVTW